MTEEKQETIYESAIQIGWLKSIDRRLRTITYLLALFAILALLAFVLTIYSALLS